MKTEKNINKNDTVKGSIKNRNGIRQVVALILSFVTMLLLLSEISTFVLYGVPMIGIKLFQMTGIGIQSGLTLSQFTVSDASVMFMMWIMPCLFFVGISIYVHCKLIKFAFRKIIGWLKIVFMSSKKS